jgi:hypothetical protein
MPSPGSDVLWNRRAGLHQSRLLPWPWQVHISHRHHSLAVDPAQHRTTAYMSMSLFFSKKICLCLCVCLVPTLTDYTHVFTEEKKIQTFILPRTCSKEPPWILIQSYYIPSFMGGSQHNEKEICSHGLHKQPVPFWELSNQRKIEAACIQVAPIRHWSLNCARMLSVLMDYTTIIRLHAIYAL